MAIYLKKFETQAAYDAAYQSLILPNVSLTVDNNVVHYNPSTPPTPSHDFVEIGGIKWATMNIGANSITDTGLYFQWGDTQGYTADQVGEGDGKKYFGWGDYKYSEGGSSSSDWGTITKYNESDGLTTLQSTDDAVTAVWGGNWRMPTTAEYAALGNAVNTVWTADYQGSGVAGTICTDKTDSTKVLFFPACGYAGYGSIDTVDEKGYYFSSSAAADYGGCYGMWFYDGNIIWNGRFDTGIGRFNGMLVRGILDE